MEIGLCLTWENERCLLEEWLRSWQHCVTIIQDTTMLHDCLWQHRIQLVIASDLVVTFDEIRLWRVRVPAIDWIAVTTTPSYAWAEAAMLAGVIGFCALPASRSRIEALLTHARLQRSCRLQALSGMQTTEAGIDLSQPIESALAYIGAHLAEHLTLREVSRIVYLSPSHFSRLFAQKVGIPFNEYVLSCRINAARTLLTETHLPIELIAAKVGIGSASQFSQTFKRMTGFSPRAYRSLRTAML